MDYTNDAKNQGNLQHIGSAWWGVYPPYQPYQPFNQLCPACSRCPGCGRPYQQQFGNYQMGTGTIC